MCGIIGHFNPHEQVGPLDLGRMRHRGPDASGDWSSPDGNCWLGHVRLSILDLSSAGAQPMQSHSGRCVIVFNGEIYNHLEVRRKMSGVHWCGHSDTETILEAWERHGAQCLEWMRGMFAFAIFNCETGDLDLVRDRLGIKPLYFRRGSQNTIAFGSEVRALTGKASIRLHKDAEATYLATGHTPPSGFLGEDIEILRPGHWLRYAKAYEAVITPWWKPSNGFSRAITALTPEKVRADVHELLEQSIREHLLSDVPVASFLSGGIDSSIVTILAARHHEGSLRTFSVGFPQAAFDERKVAQLVAERAGTSHTEIEVTPADCLEWVQEAVSAMDLPSADAINSFIVSKAVSREGIKVALSGLGGDELFGGYPSFTDIPKLAGLGILPSTWAKQIVHLLPAQIREKIDGIESFDPFSLALVRRRWWSKRILDKVLKDGVVVWPSPVNTTGDYFSDISWAEILGYMEPMLLRDSDQMSMAVSLELRVPFLDHRLIEYVLNLPAKLKSGKPPKRLLIESFKEDLPKEVWNRPKQGFTLPMDHWMRGPLKAFAKTGVSAAREVANADWVDSVAMSFESGNTHWTRLWQIVVLGHYANRTRSVVPASELKEILAD